MPKFEFLEMTSQDPKVPKKYRKLKWARCEDGSIWITSKVLSQLEFYCALSDGAIITPKMGPMVKVEWIIANLPSRAKDWVEIRANLQRHYDKLPPEPLDTAPLAE